MPAVLYRCILPATRLRQLHAATPISTLLLLPPFARLLHDIQRYFAHNLLVVHAVASRRRYVITRCFRMYLLMFM